jgi:hypothetical protein
MEGRRRLFYGDSQGRGSGLGCVGGGGMAGLQRVAGDWYGGAAHVAPDATLTRRFPGVAGKFR